MGNKATAKVTGKGNVIVALNVESRRQMCILKDVLHVPDLEYQLLSVSNMDKLGLETSFRQGRCLVKSDSKTIASRWHERLAHVGKAGIKRMIDHGA
eukprot:IDg3514t1